MNYNETLDYLDSLELFGINLGLERIEYLLKKLNNPHQSLKIIHVAGTNGKGSVCAMISSILQTAGYKVGVYTSPHLISFRERICINHTQIPKSKVVNGVEKILPIAKEMAAKPKVGHPTYFEVVTALAFYYFYKEKVDWVILEVGMGGRLDATNVVKPLVSIITNIALEHAQYLGDDITKIAKEKAGIIKENGIVVTACDKKALDIIKKICEEKNCKLFRVGKEIKYDKLNQSISGQSFVVKGIYNKYNELFTSFLGDHQLANACCAIATVEALKYYKVVISKRFIKEGLKEAKLAGRFEIVKTSPMIILDGAHNLAGIKELRATLIDLFRDKKIILVIGISSDKNIPAMIKEIVPLASKVIVTKHKVKQRATDSKIIAKEVKKYTENFVIKDRVKEAVSYAKSIANKNDLICVTGSLFTVGEAKTMYG